MKLLIVIAALVGFSGVQDARPVFQAVKFQEQAAAEVQAFNSSQFEELKKHVDKPAKVTGKVVEVYVPASNNVVVLNFGKDIKTCFKVAINKRDFANWEGGVEAMKKMYADKELTVTGKIVLYKDTPEILVTKPAEIVVATE